MNCASCRFSHYMTQLGADGFFCRNEPPKNTLLPPTAQNPTPMLVAIWPQVDEHAWCGRFEQDQKLARTRQ